MDLPKIAYAANGEIGITCFKWLLKYNCIPKALLITENYKSRYLEYLNSFQNDTLIFLNKDYNNPNNFHKLKELRLDYILSVHFPYIFSEKFLSIPQIGSLNLHPSFLPYNRGFHTTSWSIINNSHFGATIHWIDKNIDTGDICIRKELSITPEDTADTLYKKIIILEEEIFIEFLPQLLIGKLNRIPQEHGGNLHRKADLETIRRINLNETINVRDIIWQLKALSTNKWDEAAFFEIDNIKYFVRIEIRKEHNNH